MKLLITSQNPTMEWISYFIPHFTRHVITYPCWGLCILTRPPPSLLCRTPAASPNCVHKKVISKEYSSGSKHLTGFRSLHQSSPTCFRSFRLGLGAVCRRLAPASTCCNSSEFFHIRSTTHVNQCFTLQC